MGNIAMLEKRFTSSHIDFAMLNLSFEFHTILWAFDKQKVFMLIFLDRRNSVRSLCLPLANTAFGLNFSAIDIACYSMTQVCVTHCVVRARFDDIPKRKAT